MKYSICPIIARQFAKNLLRYMGEKKLKIVVKRNVRRSKESIAHNICHSHDFCDANVFMCEAWHKVVGREMNLHSNRDNFIWNESWKIAKDNNFWVMP